MAVELGHAPAGRQLYPDTTSFSYVIFTFSGFL